MPCIFQFPTFSVPELVDSWPKFIKNQIRLIPVHPKYPMRKSSGLDFGFSKDEVPFFDPFSFDMQVGSNNYSLLKSLSPEFSHFSVFVNDIQLGSQTEIIPSSSNTCILTDGCKTSTGMMAFVPKTSEKGVSPVALRGVVQ